ncbi:MAG: protein-L-isoaspartate(D-aspartate) O-methyltransferase [Myxococcota bacterium]|jgi:protein-L-isoaspartate(D-aspartate) O-methyltransferase|nr:protein-L-isoaspartate(D-aspartate) O-methyltransferase [Myxococcota bacterium]
MMSGPAIRRGERDVERAAKRRARMRAFTGLTCVLMLAGVDTARGTEPRLLPPSATNLEREPTVSRTTKDDAYAAARNAMVDQQIVARGVSDERVLAAMRKIPRHEFIPRRGHGAAYQDSPVPIGEGQTISQPLIVAVMTEAARLGETSKVLEIGTGSGYQAAVLAEVAGEVYSIEIVPSLAERARALLHRTGYERVHLRLGDGYAGWPEAAPFDAIVVTAAPAEIPEPLVEQLAVGGRMVIPVGRWFQELIVLTRTESGVERESIFPVRFVPMTGEAQERD